MPASDDTDAPSGGDRVELLRYRIACCRGYLRRGAPIAMAIWYLAEIHRAEAELRLLAEDPPAATGENAEG
jgi:hypothetical protein